MSLSLGGLAGVTLGLREGIEVNLFGLVAGALLIWKLGVVGKFLGGVLAAVGVYNLFRLIVALRNPAGEIRVTDDEVVLPDGLCTRRRHTLPPTRVRHA